MRHLARLLYPSPRANRHQPSRWFAERMSLFFSALFLIYGVHISYYPVWLNWRGLSPQEIGLITATPIFARTFLTPYIAARADARKAHRSMIIALAIASLLVALAASTSYGFWPIFAASVVFAIAVNTIMPLTETIAVTGVRTAGHDYGRMRLWGSAMFLATTVLTGVLIDLSGPGATMTVLLASTAATAGAALLLPQSNAERRRAAAAQEAVATASGPPEAGLVAALLGKGVFVAFLVAVGAIMGSHAAFYTFGALHLKSLGVSGTAFGALWTMSILAEMALLAFSAPLVERFGPVRLLMAGAVAAIIRWGAMSLDPPFAVVVGLQALHALTYGATHVGAIHFIALAAPTRGAGTAQALYSAIGSGLITGAATIAAGHAYPHLHGQTFLLMSTLSTAGLAAAIVIDKLWDRRPLLVARQTDDAPQPQTVA